MSSILLINIKGLVQVRESTDSFLAGEAMQHLPTIADAFLFLKNDLISAYGKMSELPEQLTADKVIDAIGKFVLPSFVDSHSHLVFAASREEEFVMKIKGASYEQIASNGGGILNSANKLQQMTEEELFGKSIKRANEVISLGTGAIEIKSGYGLTLKDELKMLRVARRIGNETPLSVKTTFLGAHAVPRSHTKSSYIRSIVDEMIPAIAEERLADYIDVFCEHGFFSVDESEKILERGKEFGLKPRVHANQLHRSGGVQIGVKVGAVSVDHLENIGEEEIQILKGTSVMPTALPGAAFFLDLPFTPARNILDAGLPLAIASDFNPGSSPSGNMFFIVSLACIKMKMTPEEAINAATINTAFSMGLLESQGSITVGKLANVIVTKQLPSLAFIPYSFGSNLIDRIILKGKEIN